MKKGDLERMFALREIELEAEIGRNLPGAPSLGTVDDDGPEERARGWLDRNRERICEALAKSAKVNMLVRDGRPADRIELTAACIDALTMVFAGIPIAAIAVLIVRRGLREICAGHFGVASQ